MELLKPIAWLGVGTNTSLRICKRLGQSEARRTRTIQRRLNEGCILSQTGERVRIFCVIGVTCRPHFAIPTVQMLKAAIFTKGPIVCGVTAVSDGSSLDWDNYTGDVIDSFSSTANDQEVNHEVVIVGWDDTLQGNSVPPGAWIVKNSWGTDWGGQEQGYIKIPYNINNIGFGGSWVSAWSAASVALLLATTEQLKNKELQQIK